MLVGFLIVAPGAEAATEVRLTTGPDYPPLTDRSRADGGTATRLVREIFRRMGESVTIDWLPWARGFQSTRTGHYQATFPYLRTDERERDFLYSEALLSMPTFMWQRRGDTLDVDVPASFVGKVICVPLGFFSSLAQRLAVLVEAGQVRVERPQRKDSCVQMLAAGRVDALSGTVEEIGRLMEADGLQDKLVQAQAPLLIRPYFFIAPRTDPRSPQLIENFNAELARMRADGTYDRLMAE